MKWFTMVLFGLLFFPGHLAWPSRLEAAPLSGNCGDTGSSFAAGLENAIDFRLTSLNFIYSRQPADSDLNSDNQLQVSSLELASLWRPDLLLTFPRLSLSCKPRFELRHDHWREGSQTGQSETDSDFFVHEYAIRLPVSEGILLSYGREDLQWGPAFLLSPSNPFFSYNGRNQPKKEVESAEYARLIWSPNLQWSGSLIVNTSKGRKKLLTDFEKTCAAKLDYLAEDIYFSLITSVREHTKSARLGGFLSWNLNAAAIIYGEGSCSDDEVELLAGGSYTIRAGGTFSGEFFYNGSGVRHGSLVPKLLSLAKDEARETLFRQHYILLQYYDHDLLSNWNLLLRNTINLDDRSFSLLIHGGYNLGDHAQIFASGTLNHGDRHSELASIIDSSFMLGLELSY